ncbi:MAG: bifunctional phosphoserine phosphatase/homoserine phosphotransferase ThrH [Propionibacteriaceae bacterium]|nr:bifunctional phosphoserine phosphatase/homoserine phosphotransferase ThrH [Propionibacteriaceae bacterium]
MNTDAPWIACLDLEGVLVPEIWINVAERTGIDELRLTTRDIADYDQLMHHRFEILAANGLGLGDITDVIATMTPYPGAVDFLDWLRRHHQVVILSDTFAEFAVPLMKQLGNPTFFCNNLVVDGDRLVDYRLRLPDQKRVSVEAFTSLGFATLAMGDSYNDTTMLTTARVGLLFCPPQRVVAEFPGLPVAYTYNEAKDVIVQCEGRALA